MLVQERGIDFEPTDDYLQEVRLAGGEDELINILKSAKVTKPKNVDPALQARQTEVRKHSARGAEFFRDKRYADAENEYRAAIGLDPHDADLHVNLGEVLGEKGDVDGETGEYRKALRLNPKNEDAHYQLGKTLSIMPDLDGAIAEYRQALRLDPSDARAHFWLGWSFEAKGNQEGAEQELREAYELDPKNSMYSTYYKRFLEDTRR